MIVHTSTETTTEQELYRMVNVFERGNDSGIQRRDLSGFSRHHDQQGGIRVENDERGQNQGGKEEIDAAPYREKWSNLLLAFWLYPCDIQTCFINLNSSWFLILCPFDQQPQRQRNLCDKTDRPE